MGRIWGSGIPPLHPLGRSGLPVTLLKHTHTHTLTHTLSLLYVEQKLMPVEVKRVRFRELFKISVKRGFSIYEGS